MQALKWLRKPAFVALLGLPAALSTTIPHLSALLLSVSPCLLECYRRHFTVRCWRTAKSCCAHSQATDQSQNAVCVLSVGCQPRQRERSPQDESAYDMQDLNEQESSTDRADDQPWSPGTMTAMPMFRELYTSANRRLFDARDNVRLMERANAMVTDAAGTMLALADPVAADAANALVNLNGAGHCSDTILAGAGLTVY